MTLFDTTYSVMQRTADISDCGTYRYSLERRWGPGRAVVFGMLNPSDADHEIDDPTVRRCIGFARAWGYDALRVVNMFALRASNPRELTQHPDPVGPDNNDRLITGLADAAIVVAAWGAHPLAVDRYAELVALGILREGMYCLGTTKSGAPRHPLYVRGDAVLTDWPAAEGDARCEV